MSPISAAQSRLSSIWAAVDAQQALRDRSTASLLYDGSDFDPDTGQPSRYLDDQRRSL